MKRILITGATGFCGTFLSKALLKPQHHVIGTFYQRPQVQLDSRISLFQLDITKPHDVSNFIKRIRPHEIYHLAAQSVPRFSWNSPERTFETNVGGTLYLLDALRRFIPKSRFFLASSNQVYGKSFLKEKNLDEKALLWPESPYATSKALAEAACLDFARRHQLQVVMARSFNHVGPGQEPHFVLSDWCRQVAMMELGLKTPILEVGNLEARRDILHVQDVVDAYTRLMHRGTPGAWYNVCSGRVKPLTAYVAHLKRLAQVSLRVVVRKERLRKEDPKEMSGNSKRLQKLGWKPQKSGLQALEEMLDYWRLQLRIERGNRILNGK